MHRHSFVALMAILLPLAGGCQGEPASDPAAVRQIIEANNARITGWYATGQADSIADFFATDAWQLPPNMAPLVGRDSIVAFWRNATRAGKWTFQLAVQEVMVEGSLAAERGTYAVTFEAGPGAPFPSFQDQGNYVVVWRREADGVWRIVWDAPVSTVPLPQPTAPAR